MKTLMVTTYPDGQAVDQVTLTDSGELDYDTGQARSLFEGLVASGFTPEQAFDMRTDWSNGYVVAKLAPVVPSPGM